jgi:ParB/RepB/Spo0J family partition protein
LLVPAKRPPLVATPSRGDLVAPSGPGPRLRDAFHIPLDQLAPNPWQPRRAADPDRLQELADDISARGVLEPLLVRPLAAGGYQVIAGERRYRAATLSGRETVPCLILEVDDAEARAISLVENLQREDLDIEDEARFLAELHTGGMSLRAIGDVIHKSYQYVNRRVKLVADPAALLAYRERQVTLNDLIAGGAGAASDDVPMAELATAAQTAAAEVLQGGEFVTAGNTAGATNDAWDEERARRNAVWYKPYHKLLLHTRRLQPAEIPPPERQALQRTLGDLIDELTTLSRALASEDAEA